MYNCYNAFAVGSQPNTSNVWYDTCASMHGKECAYNKFNGQVIHKIELWNGGFLTSA